MPYLTKTFKRLNDISTRSVNNFGAQYDAFSVFIFVFYLANPLKWHFSGPYSFSIIACLRAGAVILWGILLLWRYWPKSIKRYLPLFWHFCLFYHLPFRTTFSTLYSSHSPSFDSFGLLGIAALAILVDDKAFCLLTVLGVICGSLVYFGFGGLAISFIKLPKLIYASLMVFSIMFIKLIFFRNHHVNIYEKSKAYKIFAGAIAHELRQPICTLKMAGENMNHMAGNADVKTVRQQSNKALRIIESILLQIKCLENGHKTTRTNQSIKECLFATVNDNYFSDQDRLHVTINLPRDHMVLGDKVLLVQVFTNLIKNALWAIKVAGRSEIVISAKEYNNMIRIEIFDNGVGISSTNQKQLFTPFFSDNKNGVGLGLAFCKLAIENMGGSIKCDSKKGHHTNFIIQLLSAGEVTKEASYEVPSSMFVSNHHRVP